MTLPFAGLARARARMIGGRLEGEAQKWNQDQEEAQRLFREWATRKQLDDTASERQASREWQQNVFTEGQREREQARADQAAWRQQQAEDAKAYRDAQMQENARLQKERLEQQRELAGQQLETRRMLAAMGARQGGGGGGQSASGGMPPADNKDEMPLRKEFNKEMTRHTQIAPALAKIKESAKLGTGQGDIGIIYGFMRLQDPGSTVREGEYATAQNSAGIPDQVRQLYNKALSGEKLAPEVRDRFVTAANRLGQQEREQAQQMIQRYAGLAVRYGMPANAVVYDPYKSVLGPYQTKARRPSEVQ